ncbi:IS630 family transposase [Conexibacter sp. CPCC 206217]|uniref:IS630 family transposase n=1 Tax=Conexibacter sp. CPCC 206217 TaxID=3064574 RepID=UPI00351C15A9
MRSARRWRRGRVGVRLRRRLSLRSRIVLACAAGQGNTEIAAGLGVHRNTVALWRRRFLEFRLDGLTDEPRPGQPRRITDAKVEEVIAKTLESAPKGATHWSTRSMAAEVGLNQTAVARIWRAFGLQPHRQETWKLSRDPLFVEKVRDVVGLYLDPPERADSADAARDPAARHPRLQAPRHPHQHDRIRRDRELLTGVVLAPAEVVQQPHVALVAAPQPERERAFAGVEHQVDLADVTQLRDHLAAQHVAMGTPDRHRHDAPARARTRRSSTRLQACGEQWKGIGANSFGAGPGVSQAPPGRFMDGTAVVKLGGGGTHGKPSRAPRSSYDRPIGPRAGHERPKWHVSAQIERAPGKRNPAICRAFV